MSKIWRVEEEQIMKAGKIVGINYTAWYKDENCARTARREYRHGHYKVIPMTVLNFILDENNEITTKYQEFDGCIYKRTIYQEEKKMENINMTTAQEDIEDAIKFGWIEAQEATNTNDTKSEEETTMKNTKSMTKREAIASIVSLDAGMLAKIFGSTKYEVIDDGINKMIVTAADQMRDSDFEGCKNWIDVLFTINRWSEYKNWYLTGNADYREYMIKYGYEEAKTILRNYIQTVLNEGIATTRPESEYIRGAKDALCIA